MEKITVRLFITFMLLTASLVVGIIWFGEILADYYFMITTTSFVIGLASFLLWAVKIIYRFLER